MEPGTSQPGLEHKLSKIFPVLGKRKDIRIGREGIKKRKKEDQRRMDFWELTQDKVKNYLQPLLNALSLWSVTIKTKLFWRRIDSYVLPDLEGRTSVWTTYVKPWMSNCKLWLSATKEQTGCNERAETEPPFDRVAKESLRGKLRATGWVGDEHTKGRLSSLYSVCLQEEKEKLGKFKCHRKAMNGFKQPCDPFF